MWQQQQGQHGRKMILNIGQDDDLLINEPDEQDRSFDTVKIRYINLDSVKSISFVRLDSTTSQR